MLVLTSCAQVKQVARIKGQGAGEPLKKFAFNKFPILAYHKIGYPEGRWTRTPENFRKDLEWLHKHDYYPVNLRDVLASFEGLSQEKTPVVLSFDDSTSTQFRYLPGGEVDPDCAVGILLAFNKKYSQDWPLRATFFIVIETNDPERNIFGQPQHPEYKAQKLEQLAGWGMEVASHTYSHDQLNKLSEKGARYTLARSYKKLKELSGQEIVSLALPMGLYPINEAVFSGQYQKIKYDYKLVAKVAGGFQPIPGSKDFDPRHLTRIQAIDPEWKKYFGRE